MGTEGEGYFPALRCEPEMTPEGSHFSSFWSLILPFLFSHFPSCEPGLVHLPRKLLRAWGWGAGRGVLGKVGPCFRGGFEKDGKWGDSSGASLSTLLMPLQGNQSDMIPPFEAPSRTGEFWALATGWNGVLLFYIC